MPTEISSTLHFRTLLNAHTFLIADFYATWCPPCKTIAPVYNQLSSAHSVPGKFIFVKVNVDEQPEIAGMYGVSAMPTFILLKDGKVTGNVRGADVRGLKGIVEGATVEVKKAVQVEQQKKAEAEATKAEGSVEEKAQEGEEKTVSGSYGMTGGNNWKMSLH